nr:unnamed protein product [Callosobruchus analis]
MEGACQSHFGLQFMCCRLKNL